METKEIERRVSIAKELFASGYNCSQAVFIAYADIFNINQSTASVMSFPFGGGIGRMREVCGAFSGIALVAGQKFPVTSPADTQNKKDSFALIQNCAAIFKDKFGSIVCHELLELRKGEQPQLQENGHPVPKKISCATLVEEAARIIGEKL